MTGQGGIICPDSLFSLFELQVRTKQLERQNFYFSTCCKIEHSQNMLTENYCFAFGVILIGRTLQLMTVKGTPQDAVTTEL